MIDFSNQSAIDWLKVGALLLDIRTREEFCAGHIKGAILVPTPLPPLTPREVNVLKDQLWWTLPQYVYSHLTPIVVYCKKGKRASLSKKIIQKLGYPNVIAWGGVDESPLKELFTTHLPICICQPGRLKTVCQHYSN